jgi:hypothetical protein
MFLVLTLRGGSPRTWFETTYKKARAKAARFGGKRENCTADHPARKNSNSEQEPPNLSGSCADNLAT